jgi:hypothetical protein
MPLLLCHSEVNLPTSFNDFRPIALCNCLYKIIAKIIATRLKPILASSISVEQFGFLKGWLIHEAIGSMQEGIHSIKFINVSALWSRLISPKPMIGFLGFILSSPFACGF